MGPTKTKNLYSRGVECTAREKMGPMKTKNLYSRGVECPEREKIGPTRIKKTKSRGTEFLDRLQILSQCFTPLLNCVAFLILLKKRG